MPSAAVTNLSAYRFTQLADLPARRVELLAWCVAHNLKGTILLAPEGINLVVAGARADIDALVDYLRTWPGLADLTPKLSESPRPPFGRLLVKIKREIIAFGAPDIDPGRVTSPRVAPAVLKHWLDEGRRLTLLDTRNDYEIAHGTFRDAVPAGLTHFRDFPAAVRGLPSALKDQPVVVFCTGGIRCEKAGPLLEREGFREVYQLDGGILNYFEKVGGAHYEGGCFVFDERVAVDSRLQPVPRPDGAPPAPTARDLFCP